MSQLSPIQRLRARHEARQKARTTDIDVWEDGSLVARVGMVDTAGAVDAMRTLMRLVNNDAGDLTETDLAGVIASATLGLYSRDDGELEPLLDEHGDQLRFDARLGAALGYPEIDTPAGAVIIALTEGDPPTVNSVRMLTIATAISTWLVRDDEEAPAEGR